MEGYRGHQKLPAGGAKADRDMEPSQGQPMILAQPAAVSRRFQTLAGHFLWAWWLEYGLAYDDASAA
jgi:hypothetical protein